MAKIKIKYCNSTKLSTCAPNMWTSNAKLKFSFMINRCGGPGWEKHSNFTTCKTYFLFYSSTDWSSGEHGPVHRQLSVSSDSKLLDDDIREETRVIMRPKKPPRPKSEVFLNKHDPHPRRKRFSAFGVSCQLLIVFYAFYERPLDKLYPQI